MAAAVDSAGNEMQALSIGQVYAAVAYTGTAGNTAPLSSKAYCVRVVCTTDAFVLIGPSATATAGTGVFMPAGVPEYFSCAPGYRVSAIQLAAGGNLYVAEMS